MVRQSIQHVYKLFSETNTKVIEFQNITSTFLQNHHQLPLNEIIEVLDKDIHHIFFPTPSSSPDQLQSVASLKII